MTVIQYAEPGPTRNFFYMSVEEVKAKSKKDGILLTDDNIAEKIGISKTEYSSYLNGKIPPIEIFQAINEKFKKYSTIVVHPAGFSREITPPPPPDPKG